MTAAAVPVPVHNDNDETAPQLVQEQSPRPPRRRRRGNNSQDIFLPTAFALTMVLMFILSRLVTMEPRAQHALLDLAHGKSFVITGASAGIGLAAVRNLYQHAVLDRVKLKSSEAEVEDKAMLVIMGCRNLDKCEKARASILQEACNDINNDTQGGVNTCQNYDSVAQLVCLELDLESQKSVKKFAKAVQQTLKKYRDKRQGKAKALDVLMNNAGIMGVEEERQADSNGALTVDKTMQVNHVGHFLLTSLLMPNLLASSYGGRVVNVSSLLGFTWLPQFLEAELDDFELQRKPYNSITSYRQSKRANLLFTQALHDRFHGINNFTVVASHPGYSRTSLQMSGWKFAPEVFKAIFAHNPVMSMSSSSGSLTTLKAALSLEKIPSNKVVGPIFVSIGTPIVIGSSLSPFPSFGSIDDSAVDALWKYSEAVIGESFYKHK